MSHYPDSTDFALLDRSQGDAAHDRADAEMDHLQHVAAFEAAALAAFLDRTVAEFQKLHFTTLFPVKGYDQTCFVAAVRDFAPLSRAALRKAVTEAAGDQVREDAA